MSDTPQGPGWWQASDGKWYPPEQAPGAQGGDAGGGGGTGLGETLSYAWNKFVQNIGEWIILWLILIAITIVVAVLGVVIASGSAGGFTFRFNALSIVIGIIGGIIQGILLVVLAKAAVQAVNGSKIDIGKSFALTGNNIMAGAAFGLINGVLVSFCGFLGIVVFLFLGFLPILSALDDKGLEAIGESINLSTSRASEAMLFWLVAWFIAGCLCFLGAPIAMLGGTYLVKRFRGEPVAA